MVARGLFSSYPIVTPSSLTMISLSDRLSIILGAPNPLFGCGGLRDKGDLTIPLEKRQNFSKC
jgi:hypothetical protein